MLLKVALNSSFGTRGGKNFDPLICDSSDGIESHILKLPWFRIRRGAGIQTPVVDWFIEGIAVFSTSRHTSCLLICLPWLMAWVGGGLPVCGNAVPSSWLPINGSPIPGSSYFETLEAQPQVAYEGGGWILSTLKDSTVSLKLPWFRIRRGAGIQALVVDWFIEGIAVFSTSRHTSCLLIFQHWVDGGLPVCGNAVPSSCLPINGSATPSIPGSSCFDTLEAQPQVAYEGGDWILSTLKDSTVSFILEVILFLFSSSFALIVSTPINKLDLVWIWFVDYYLAMYSYNIRSHLLGDTIVDFIK